MDSSTSDLRRRRINNNNQTNREVLFQNNKSISPSKKKNNKPSKAEDESQSKAIKSSLLRTKQMMQNELQRVSDVTSTIQNDGKKIQNTKDHHVNMSDSVKGAKINLLWLKVKEKEDSIVFWASVTFFYVVVLYVMWTRIRIPFFLW